MSTPHYTQKDKPCAQRKRFNDKRTAQAACYRIANTDKTRYYPEPCTHCNGYHLTVGV